MLDKNKKELKAWDLFKFTDGWQLIYQTFSKWDHLKFKGYSFVSRKDFDTDDLSDFKFEIIWSEKDWIDANYYEIAKREQEKNWVRFLDS